MASSRGTAYKVVSPKTSRVRAVELKYVGAQGPWPVPTKPDAPMLMLWWLGRNARMPKYWEIGLV